MTWWGRLRRTPSEEWYFSHLPADRTPAGGEQVEVRPEQAYLSAHLASMHVTDLRVGTTTFHGSATGVLSLTTRSGDRAEFVSVTTPRALRDADPVNLDRLVVVNKRLLGPVPYRGGDLDLELGLFSVPSADLLDPYLGLVEEITTFVGVSFVAAARPLVSTAKHALDLLFGEAQAPTLEIGIATSFASPVTGFYCVVRAPRSDPSLHGLGLADDRRLIRADGRPVTEPYLVFQLTASAQRDDWATIPALQDRYDAIRDAADQGDLIQGQHAVETFGRVAVFSPDLLAADGVRLRGLVRHEMRLAFPETGTAAVGRTGRAMPDLAALPLYGPVVST